MDDVQRRLSAAKLWLTATGTPTGLTPGAVGDSPYLAHALFALAVVPTPAVELLAADEQWRLYANPERVLAEPVPVLGRHLAHLVWHLLYDHAGRARTIGVTRATAPAWATATHVVVGETFDACGFGPHDLPAAARIGMAPRRSAEEYYARVSGLPVVDAARDGDGGPMVGGCGSAADGLARGYELPATDAAGAVGPLAAMALRQRIAIEVREHLARRGDRPGEWSRWVERILAPKVPWPQVLAAAVRRAVGWTAGQADFTYSRPSRRQAAAPRVRLPGMRRPLPAVAVVLDTSGSVDDAMLAQALGEVDGALRGTGVAGESVTVIACDAAVQSTGRVRAAREVVLGGGGGTDLRHGIREASALRPRPDVVVVLTDGETPWPAEPLPGTVTVAALLGRPGDPLPATPPWAVRVECRLDA